MYQTEYANILHRWTNAPVKVEARLMNKLIYSELYSGAPPEITTRCDFSGQKCQIIGTWPRRLLTGPTAFSFTSSCISPSWKWTFIIILGTSRGFTQHAAVGRIRAFAAVFKITL